MEFSLVHADKLKVILSQEDMEELQVRYEDMDYSDDATRKALVRLLERGRDEVGFRPRKAKLFIEVYPCEGGGCVLYFTALRKGLSPAAGKGIEPVIFEFRSVTALTDGACKVFERYSHRIYKSSLYRMHGRYRLIVYPLDYSDRLSVFFLSEYAEKIGEGELMAAFTEEHGHEIIRDTAIDTLSEYFSLQSDWPELTD